MWGEKTGSHRSLDSIRVCVCAGWYDGGVSPKYVCAGESGLCTDILGGISPMLFVQETDGDGDKGRIVGCADVWDQDCGVPHCTGGRSHPSCFCRGVKWGALMNRGSSESALLS